MKTCSQCRRTKPRGEFGVSRQCPDGLFWYCRDCSRSTNREHRRRVRERVIAAYGGCCVCCGETGLPFLAIDHVANDGAVHRREAGFRNGQALYAWLVRQGFPDGFQVLCHNCNMAKQFNGGTCPHVDGSVPMVRAVRQLGISSL